MITIHKVEPEKILHIQERSVYTPYQDIYTQYYFSLLIGEKRWDSGLSSYKESNPEGPLDGNYLDILSGFVTILEGDDWKDWIRNHTFIKTYGDGSQSIFFAYTDEEGYILNFSGVRCGKANAVALR